MLTQVITIALGVVFGFVLLVTLIFIVEAIRNARDEKIIRDYERAEGIRLAQQWEAKEAARMRLDEGRAHDLKKAEVRRSTMTIGQQTTAQRSSADPRRPRREDLRMRMRRDGYEYVDGEWVKPPKA